MEFGARANYLLFTYPAAHEINASLLKQMKKFTFGIWHLFTPLHAGICKPDIHFPWSLWPCPSKLGAVTDRGSEYLAYIPAGNGVNK